MADRPETGSRKFTERRFPPERASVQAARHWLRELVSDRLPSPRVNLAELLLSELAANAVVHAGTEFTVRVRQDEVQLRVEVIDESRELPRALHFAPDATAGRGYSMVRSLSDDSGVEPNDGSKAVWFEVDVDAP